VAHQGARPSRLPLARPTPPPLGPAPRGPAPPPVAHLARPSSPLRAPARRPSRVPRARRAWQLRRRRCLVVGPTCQPHPKNHLPAHLLYPGRTFSLSLLFSKTSSACSTFALLAVSLVLLFFPLPRPLLSRLDDPFPVWRSCPGSAAPPCATHPPGPLPSPWRGSGAVCGASSPTPSPPPRGPPLPGAAPSRSPRPWRPFGSARRGPSPSLRIPALPAPAHSSGAAPAWPWRPSPARPRQGAARPWTLPSAVRPWPSPLAARPYGPRLAWPGALAPGSLSGGARPRPPRGTLGLPAPGAVPACPAQPSPVLAPPCAAMAPRPSAAQSAPARPRYLRSVFDPRRGPTACATPPVRPALHAAPNAARRAHVARPWRPARRGRGALASSPPRRGPAGVARPGHGGSATTRHPHPARPRCRLTARRARSTAPARLVRGASVRPCAR
jgi:hypothetical protein